MSEKSVRIQRVQKELQHLIATYLHNEIADPMPAHASVTAVEVAGDLRNAAVYFRIVGPSTDISESEKVLEQHRKRIQKTAAQELPLKFCPVLEFRYGKAREGDEVDRLLADLNRRKTPWD